MISIIPKSDVTAAALKHLNTLTTLSLGEIKQACLEAMSIRDIMVFGQFDGMSDEDRQELLIRVLNEMRAGKVPYRVFEVYENGDREELTADTLLNRIEHFEDIRNQVDRDENR